MTANRWRKQALHLQTTGSVSNQLIPADLFGCPRWLRHVTGSIV
jgi:hypothetical protein